MRPYASRSGSPERGVSPVRMNAGLAVPVVETHLPVVASTEQRGVLLPDTVLSWYCPFGAVSSTMNLRTFGYAGSVCGVARVWAKNADIDQRSVRFYAARYELTCSRWPKPLWQLRQSSGMPRKRSPDCVARLSKVSWIGPFGCSWRT